MNQNILPTAAETGRVTESPETTVLVNTPTVRVEITADVNPFEPSEAGTEQMAEVDAAAETAQTPVAHTTKPPATDRQLQNFMDELVLPPGIKTTDLDIAA